MDRITLELSSASIIHIFGARMSVLSCIRDEVDQF